VVVLDIFRSGSLGNFVGFLAGLVIGGDVGDRTNNGESGFCDSSDAFV